ncbi:serine carboxypeptidase [Tothia fuscella]|uniref:Serine carboxypeptidase n=1 Tax=Tothia fuscella TaxID=1048955 RepID=A0A9P4NHD5_9PEZI|nr:serine carboxypeptidase [Tothia fuscella]
MLPIPLRAVLALTIALTSSIHLTLAYPHKDHPNSILAQTRYGNRTLLGTSTFTQPIDHKNPSLGNFSQFYYWSDEHWAGPGSPVIMFTPGEANVTGYNSYLTLNRTTGVVAREIGAAVVVVEHRYWGVSSPFANLSTDNLQYLTLENSIADFVRFAKEAKLPFDVQGNNNADNAPWLFVGGSYSGALAAWIESISPGTFWAYWASSAPVQSMDYWQYFVPVQQGMPKNCSADVTKVVDYVDQVGYTGSEEEKKAFQTRFGLGNLEHYEDFASALQNGPWLWQGNQFYQNSGFYDFCDAVEGADTPSSNNSSIVRIPTAEGVGVEKAVAGYARWVNETMLPGFCASYGYAEWQGPYNTKCFDTHDPASPLFTDWSLSNQFDRQWVWMTCNEPFGYWQDAAPRDRPSIVSRFVNEKYWTRQCGLFFPEVAGETYGIAKGKTYDDVNEYTGGWNIDNSTRLLHVNGQFDPWREASVASDFRPLGPLQSIEKVPTRLVPGGFHTSDLVTRNGVVNAAAKEIIDQGVQIMAEWVKQWPAGK